MKHPVVGLLFIALLFPVSVSAASKYATIYSVNKVECSIGKSNPPVLILGADGTVTSSGWSNGQFSPWVYVTPPSDGIWDMTFIAKKPKGVVLWVMSKISANDVFTKPDWVKGVRIHASKNKIEKKCPGANKAAEEIESSEWEYR